MTKDVVLRFAGNFLKETAGVGVYQREVDATRQELTRRTATGRWNADNQAYLEEGQAIGFAAGVLHLGFPLLINSMEDITNKGSNVNKFPQLLGSLALDWGKMFVLLGTPSQDFGKVSLFLGAVTAAEHLVTSTVIAARQTSRRN